MDRSSSYSNFLWASRLGHAKSALCAANMLYESCVMATKQPRQVTASFLDANVATSTNLESSELAISHNLQFAASLYHQAANGGIVEAMNAYGVMLEDGSVNGLRGGDAALELAATWYHAAAEGGLLEAVGELKY
jgi:hypothetical protein